MKSSDGILECNLCERKFLSGAKFMKHQARCTQETAPLKSRYLFQCEKCLQRFPIASNLYKHRKLYCEFGEPRPKKTYPCDGCLFEFTDQSNLRQHKKLGRCKGLQHKGSKRNVNVRNDGLVNSQSTVPESINKQDNPNVKFGDISTSSCNGQSLQGNNMLSENRMGYHALFGGMVPGLFLGYPQNTYPERDTTQINNIPAINNLIATDTNTQFTAAPNTVQEANVSLDQRAELPDLAPSIENTITGTEIPRVPDVDLQHNADAKDIKQEVIIGEPDYNSEVHVMKDEGISFCCHNIPSIQCKYGISSMQNGF